MTKITLTPAVSKILVKFLTQYLKEDGYSPKDQEFLSTFNSLKLHRIDSSCDLFMIWDSIGMSGDEVTLARADVRRIYKTLGSTLYSSTPRIH